MGRQDSEISQYKLFEVLSVPYTNGGNKVTLQHYSVQHSAVADLHTTTRSVEFL